MKRQKFRFISFRTDLGPAPGWCSTLTGMTEEVEEDPEPQIYDNYKFLSLAEVESLGLSGSIGQKWMRAEMHGYFIKMDLYMKLKAISQPFDYETYKKKQSKKKELKSRIAVDQNDLSKVNKKLAEQLMTEEKSKVKTDERFAQLFKDEDLEIDEESEEFKLHKPHQMKLYRKRKLQQNTPNWYEEDDDDDDDDDEFKQEIKKQHRLINEARKQKERAAKRNEKSVQLFDK